MQSSGCVHITNQPVLGCGCASPASGVLDTLVMGTTDAAASGPTTNGFRDPSDFQGQPGVAEITVHRFFQSRFVWGLRTF